MVTFLIALAVLLFVNFLLFTFSVNKSKKEVIDLVIEKNEEIIAHTQKFNPEIETSKTSVSNTVITKRSEAVLVAE